MITWSSFQSRQYLPDYAHAYNEHILFLEASVFYFLANNDCNHYQMFILKRLSMMTSIFVFNVVMK